LLLQKDESEASAPETASAQLLSGGNGNLRLAGDEGARVRPAAGGQVVVQQAAED